MLPIFTARISTLIASAFHYYSRSSPSVVSLACGQCGLSLDARREDGISGSCFVIDLNQPNWSHSKLRVVLTPDAKLSILCACSTSDVTARRPSGASDGTSCIPKKSESFFAFRNGRPEHERTRHVTKAGGDCPGWIAYEMPGYLDPPLCDRCGAGWIPI